MRGGSRRRRPARGYADALQLGSEGGSTNTLTRSSRACSRKLLGALPVDVEQHVASGCKRLLDRLARRAVAVAEHLGVFQQSPRFAMLIELLARR